MTEKKYRILGYTNPLGLNYSPLCTIIQDGLGIGVIWPDKTTNKLNQMPDQNDESFIAEENEKMISLNETCILIKDRVITGTDGYILQELKDHLADLDESDINRELIKDIIKLYDTEIKNSPEIYPHLQT